MDCDYFEIDNLYCGVTYRLKKSLKSRLNEESKLEDLEESGEPEADNYKYRTILVQKILTPDNLI